MASHKCDFCHAVIVASPGEVTSVISYLPCFHVLCQNCKIHRLKEPEPFNCLVCNNKTYSQELFDLVVGDQKKMHCKFCADRSEMRGRVEFRCSYCTDALYCSECAAKHRHSQNHELKLIQTAILPRSQCYEHNDVPAVAECECGMRVCDSCQYQHISKNHTCKLYNEGINDAMTKLHAKIERGRQEICQIQKQLLYVTKHRAELHSMAAKARTAVASEIVELCNALIRRGNDVVTAIDIAENAKIKMCSRIETELKTAQQKLKKIDCLLNMTVHSVMPDDIVAPTAALNFSDSAYQIIDGKKTYIKKSMDVLQTPQIFYTSNLPPVLSAINTLGQLEVDGQIRTPLSVTPPSARMFTVTSTAVPSITLNATPTSDSCTLNMNRTTNMPMTRSIIHNPAMSSQNETSRGDSYAAQIPSLFTLKQPKKMFNSPSIPSHAYDANCLFNTSSQLPNPTLTKPYVNFATNTGVMQHAQYLQQQAALQKGINELNLPQMITQPAALALQHRNIHNQQRSMPPSLPNNFTPRHLEHTGATMIPLNHSSAMTHQLFLQQQLQLQQQQRQKLLQDDHGLTNKLTCLKDTSSENQNDSSRSGSRRNSFIIQSQQENSSNQEISQYSSQDEQRQSIDHQSQNNQMPGICDKQNSKDSYLPTSEILLSTTRSSSSLSPDSSVQIYNTLITNEVAQEKNPADFPTNSPSITTTNSEAGNIVDEIRRPGSTNSVSSVASSTNTRLARANTLNNVSHPLNNVGSTSLAPKLLLKKKSTDGTYAADLVETSHFSSDSKNTISAQNKKNTSTNDANSISNECVDDDIENANTIKIKNDSDANLVKGYFHKQQTQDEWDDYCYVCSQGCDDTTGDLGCCDNCPHVYHNKCHIPAIKEKMNDLPDNWRCSLCVPCEPISEAATSFGSREQLLCSKVILECFAKNLDAEPFYNPVPGNLIEYYELIKRPICLADIAQKISCNSNNVFYESVQQFIDDMNLLFKNCSLFNSPSAAIAVSGRKLYALYRDAIRKYLPYYERRVWVYVSLREDFIQNGTVRQKRGSSVGGGQSKRAKRASSKETT